MSFSFVVSKIITIFAARKCLSRLTYSDQKCSSWLTHLIEKCLSRLTRKHKNEDVGYTRQVKALLHVISQMTPYEVDISKLSKASGISRQSTLKYLTNLEEANLIRRVFTNLMNVTDLQKPDKIYLDNTNLLYTLSLEKPEIGTVRETFFANQLASAGHKVEYAGYKKGDFRIDGNIVIEVGGQDKGFSQVAGQENAYVAADDIESAYMSKIPLWAFGFLY